MRTDIYYFSGTGNSLAIAQNIAEELGDTRLIPIPKAVQNGLDTTAPQLGLVFPVYVWGLPRMVADFEGAQAAQRTIRLCRDLLRRHTGWHTAPATKNAAKKRREPGCGLCGERGQQHSPHV